MVLADRVAVVTGAGRGIGHAVAAQMALAGAAVVLVDHDEATVTAAADELAASGHAVRAVVADISTAEGNRRAVEQALVAFGRVDVFHANAGIAVFADLLQETPAQIERTLAVNLAGAVHGCAAVLPHMVSRRQGVILLTASVAAMAGDPLVPVYCASKGGLTALCKSLAVRHGPDGIRCNTLCPGDVRTPMLESLLTQAADPEAARRELVLQYPLRRLIEPEEVGQLAVFLASDAARSITGADIVIDAGLMARVY